MENAYTRTRPAKISFDGIRDLPRHALALNKQLLRWFLAQPIRPYEWKMATPEDQRRAIARDCDDRFAAMLALYGIPDDWPLDLQYQQLAAHLAGELFAGCKTLKHGRGGGPSAKAQAERRELHRALFSHFEAAKQRRPGRSDRAIAIDILGKHRKDCLAARLSNPKALAQAMNAVRKESGSETHG